MLVSRGEKFGLSRQRVETGWHRVEWSRQGVMGLRPFGSGVDQERDGVCIELHVLCFLAIHTASFASESVQLPLARCT